MLPIVVVLVSFRDTAKALSKATHVKKSIQRRKFTLKREIS